MASLARHDNWVNKKRAEAICALLSPTEVGNY
jgi:hypothetical protein